jgi:hypothetical protein
LGACTADDPDRARDWVEQPGCWPWADVHANAFVLVGRQDEADAFLTCHEEVAREHGHASATARLAYARGRWYGVRGDLDAARCDRELAADGVKVVRGHRELDDLAPQERPSPGWSRRAAATRRSPPSCSCR